MNNLTEIKKLPQQMLAQARTLQTGAVIFAYKDGTAVRMETENGRHTYVWRRNGWKQMKNVFR